MEAAIDLIGVAMVVQVGHNHTAAAGYCTIDTVLDSFIRLTFAPRRVIVIDGLHRWRRNRVRKVTVVSLI